MEKRGGIADDSAESDYSTRTDALSRKQWESGNIGYPAAGYLSAGYLSGQDLNRSIFLSQNG